jgi:uncharacterized membrane protein
MGHTIAVDGQSFFCKATPNRSLTAAGRTLWVGILAMTVLLLAIAATLIGAWPVLPFAGLEIGLVWFAFNRVAAHDSDFETLKVRDAMFVFETQNGKEKFSLSGNARWVVLECRMRLSRCGLTLRYRGQEAVVGRLLNDNERMGIAMSLRRMIKVHHQEDLTQ